MSGGVLWVVGFYVNHVPLSLIRNLLAYNLKITFPCYSLRLIIRSQWPHEGKVDPSNLPLCDVSIFS